MLSLYGTTVLIWGTTWYAIKSQLGVVPADVSVVYRFALAAAVLLLWCRMRGVSLRARALDQLFIALQGLMLFALNYLLFYHATSYITSGLAAVVFSTVIIFNMLFAALFFRQLIAPRVIAGALLGVVGIGLVFWPEFAVLHAGRASTKGFILSLAATVIASLGNILSARNSRAGIPVLRSNTLGMLYGALMMAAYVWLSGETFGFDPRPVYVLSLVYLALFGSVIAFGCYLTLIARIGPERAAYATVLFPIVALALSTVYEAYHWSASALAGVALALAGNMLVLRGRTA